MTETAAKTYDLTKVHEANRKLLKEIEYSGDFTYEIHRYTSQIPDALVPAALKYSVEVGNYLLSLAE